MAVEIKNKNLIATFRPDKGMNCVSFKKGALEAIDQSTENLFRERFAGLGAMIGPHFHRRPPEEIVPVQNESLFPHIQVCHAKGINEPFSHGIGRYAPWKVEQVQESLLHASLKGSDLWEGVPLKQLEGQDFEMTYKANLLEEGLQIELFVSSERASIVGLHTYYALAGGQGRVIAAVQSQYNEGGVFKPIPSTWNYDNNHLLTYELDCDADFAFLPYPSPFHGEILMETQTHHLRVQYWSENEENSWQLWHPNGSSFVCIEPLSAKNPRKCRLSESRIKILISIL